MGDDFERVLCIKREVFVFRIPPKTSNRGYRASDWTLDNPDWTGRLRIVTLNNNLRIKLEDNNSGQLFAECPLDSYPNPAVEPVVDSSRYFVIRIQEDTGRSAFIGIGFADRSDSFDMLVSLQDHFKSKLRDEKIEEEKKVPETKLDLGFKEGQTIKLNIASKSTSCNSKSSRPKPSGMSVGLGGILAPPPKLSAPHSGATSRQPVTSGHSADLVTSISSNTPAVATKTDEWGDFTGSTVQSVPKAKTDNWVDFN